MTTVPEASKQPRIDLPYERRIGARFISVRADEDPETLAGSIFFEIRDDDGMCAVEAWLSPGQRRELIAALLAAEPDGGVS